MLYVSKDSFSNWQQLNTWHCSIYCRFCISGKHPGFFWKL